MNYKYVRSKLPYKRLENQVFHKFVDQMRQCQPSTCADLVDSVYLLPLTGHLIVQYFNDYSNIMVPYWNESFLPESPLHESFPCSPPAHNCFWFNDTPAKLYTLLQRFKLNPSISNFNFTSLRDAANQWLEEITIKSTFDYGTFYKRINHFPFSRNRLQSQGHHQSFCSSNVQRMAGKSVLSNR